MNIVDLMLQRDADLDAESKFEKRTALQLAASHGYYDLVKLLCDKGAALDKPDIYGTTPLQVKKKNNL